MCFFSLSKTCISSNFNNFECLSITENLSKIFRDPQEKLSVDHGNGKYVFSTEPFLWVSRVRIRCRVRCCVESLNKICARPYSKMFGSYMEPGKNVKLSAHTQCKWPRFIQCTITAFWLVQYNSGSQKYVEASTWPTI